MANVKFSQFAADGNVQQGDIIVGLRAGTNAQFTLPGGAGLFWSAISGSSQTAIINTGLIPQGGTLTTITLPATAPIGSVVAIQGQGSGGWVIQAPGTQLIRIGASPTSAGGTVASANQYDAITLICIVANTEWAMYGPVTSGFTIN
jgi:hypothetical protein